MAGELSLRVPGTLELPAKFFGALTGSDLLRIGVPTIGAVALVTPIQSGVDLLTILTGVAIGCGLAFLRPKHRTLDQHLRSAIRFLAEGRTLSEPPLATPDQRYLRRSDGTVIGLVEVAPVNLTMQSQPEQAALHRTYQDLLETITYPVIIHSRQRRTSLETYLTQLTQTGPGDAQRQNRVRHSSTAYCEQFADHDLVTTQHVVAIRVAAPTRTAFQTKLSTAYRRVCRRMNPVLPITLPTPA